MGADNSASLNEIGKMREAADPSNSGDNAMVRIAGSTYSQDGSADYLKVCSGSANAQDSSLPNLAISFDGDGSNSNAPAPDNDADSLQTLDKDLVTLEQDLQQLSSVMKQLLGPGADSGSAPTTPPAKVSDTSDTTTTITTTTPDTTPATPDTTTTTTDTTPTTPTTPTSSDQVSTEQQAYNNGPAYYASADGSGSGLDASDPTSLANAQKLMEKSDIKTVDLEGGTYNLNQSINLTGADSGETWQYYQPDGVGSAVLDGGSTNANNGISDMIDINDASNITVNGLGMQNFQAYGINDTGSSASSEAANNTFENNTIGDNTVTSWQSAGITTSGWAPDTTIANNDVHDVGSQGIALFDNWSGNGGTGDVSGDVVQGNAVLNSVQRMSDGGGIYVEMHGGDQPTTPVTIADNYVAGQGSSATWGRPRCLSR